MYITKCCGWVHRGLQSYISSVHACCQQDAAALADQHGDCKVHVNYWKHHGDRKIKLLQWTVTLTSLHSQWDKGQYHASEDCDCPHRLGCCVSLNVVCIKPIDVWFLIFAHWSPCQQCRDSVAGPDVGRSAAGAEFPFYHSNFVILQLELKAHKNCRHRLVDFSSW